MVEEEAENVTGPVSQDKQGCRREQKPLGVPECDCLYLGQWMHADVIETKKKNAGKRVCG